MEPTQQTAQLKQKIPPGFRRQLLAGLFRGLWRWLALGVAATAISTVTAYLVPLVITFTVDSVIGTKPMGLPGFSEFELWQTSETNIRAARKALDAL